MFAALLLQAQTAVPVYRNPVLPADYSDPDAIRVGDDYYMTASSFNHVPGLPLLHSRDLVHWNLIGHALPRLVPEEHFRTVRHGGGVWAPSIRFHKGRFHIYYPDPDFGIYLVTARDIRGPWSTPRLVLAGKGLIDPCPFWDDDGKAYLAHAYAGSRAGIKSILVIRPMNATGDSITGEAVMVYDGHEKDPTVEGPKLYKRNGWYYIFAPAGGVSTGWQTVLRSRSVYGPYERKVVMHQGPTAINGPHQGAWVNTPSGEDWFLHFQDREAYGRIVHLQPMQWKDGWPVIGDDPDGDGTGQPVWQHKKPALRAAFAVPVVTGSDEFNVPRISPHWQWSANPAEGWAFATNEGYLRFFSQYTPDTLTNYWNLPGLLHQKFPAETFTATVCLRFSPRHNGEKTGLMVFGTDYAWLGLEKTPQGLELIRATCEGADRAVPEKKESLQVLKNQVIYLRVSAEPGARCRFAWSEDGRVYTTLPGTFTAKPGRWVGALLGLFCVRENMTNDAGYADLDWFRIEIPETKNHP